MKFLGVPLRVAQTASQMVPAAGVTAFLLPTLTLLGLVAAVFDFGMPTLAKATVGAGMFAAGAMFSHLLPIWRPATPVELALYEQARDISPLAPWVRFAKDLGLRGALLAAAGLAVLIWLASR